MKIQMSWGGVFGEFFYVEGGYFLQLARHTQKSWKYYFGCKTDLIHTFYFVPELQYPCFG